MTGSGESETSPIKALLTLAVVGGVAFFLWSAWNNGKAQAQRSEAISGACGAASSVPAEVQACEAGMEASYAGPVDDLDRLANAAAQYAADARRP